MHAHVVDGSAKPGLVQSDRDPRLQRRGVGERAAPAHGSWWCCRESCTLGFSDSADALGASANCDRSLNSTADVRFVGSVQWARDQ